MDTRRQAKPETDSIASFGFGNGYYKKMRVTSLIPARKVVWKCAEAHPEWVGTDLTFDLTEKDVFTFLTDKVNNIP